MLVQRFAPFSPLVYLALATCVEHPSSPRAPRPQAADVAASSAPVLLAAGEAGQAWDAGLLQRFLIDPEDMFPGLWMGANGLRDAADRAAVAAFLAGTGAGPGRAD